MSVLNKITFHSLGADQYYSEETNKTQIYLHHTAGNPDPYSVVKWWDSTPEHVATAFIIGRTPPSPSSNWKDGEIIQVFNSKFWAHHLGLKKEHLKSKSNLELNKFSIGIEICNWGQLTKDEDKFKTYVNSTVSPSEVVTYKTPFRGFNYYQQYTDAQLDSVRELLLFLCDKYCIPKEYKGDSIFDIDARALNGESGIFSHVSVRPDKNDCHPQLELVEMLRSL